MLTPPFLRPGFWIPAMNPWNLTGFGGQYLGEPWVPLSVFEAAFATYDDMAVVLN